MEPVRELAQTALPHEERASLMPEKTIKRRLKDTHDAAPMKPFKTNDDSLTAALRWSTRFESSQRCRAADYELLFRIQKGLVT